jgi:hypothetical protein
MARLHTSAVRRTSFACVTAVVVALAAPAADASKPPKDLWATVNICNTAKHPDSLGVRGRMPGNGTKQKMAMRFTAQYKSNHKWHNAGSPSPWRSAGSAVFSWGETGWTFDFQKPTTGTQLVLRGLVNFRWKIHGKVVRTARAITTAHHPSAGADPKNYSAAICRIKG